MDDFEKAKQFFMEGLKHLEANNLEAAETQFARSLAIIPDRVSTLNNLSAVKIKREKFAEAEALALKAVAADENSPEAWSNVGDARAAMNRHEEALQAYDRALACKSAYAKAWLNKAVTLLKLKRPDEALQDCKHALKLEPKQHEILYAQSLILKELGRLEEARKVYLGSLEARTALSPVFIAERRPDQKAEILVISHNPNLDDAYKSFDTLHRECPNYPGQLARLFQEDFHFTLAFEGVATRSSARGQIPQPDLLINNCANGDLALSTGYLPQTISLIDSFGVPVVNHPTKVVQTLRDESAKLLGGVPGVLVPKTMRFSSAGKSHGAVAREIEEHYDYPLITRTLFGQESEGMTKVDSREALVTVLDSGLPEKFFVTEFVDSRGKHPFFRKIRAAIVQNEIIVVRVDYDAYWSVHARKSDERVTFYLANAHLLDEEKRICRDPEAALGRPVIRALRAIRERVPLDVFGIDFDVDAAGSLVFYEANATMNLLSTAKAEVPYPVEKEECLRLAFKRYLESLLAGHQLQSALTVV